MDLDLPKAAVAAVDEASIKMPAELQAFADYLLASLDEKLKGMRVTITMTVEAKDK